MGPRGEASLTRRDGPLVPRADIEAVVAAEDAVAEGFAVFDGNGALVLDGQVGEALARTPAVDLKFPRSQGRTVDPQLAGAPKPDHVIKNMSHITHDSNIRADGLVDR